MQIMAKLGARSDAVWSRSNRHEVPQHKLSIRPIAALAQSQCWGLGISAAPKPEPKWGPGASKETPRNPPEPKPAWGSELLGASRRLETPRNSSKLLEFLETPRKPPRLLETPSRLLEIPRNFKTPQNSSRLLETPRNSSKLLRNSSKLLEKPRDSSRLLETPRNSSKLDENPSRLLETPRKSSKLLENPLQAHRTLRVFFSLRPRQAAHYKPCR